jgi:uncharacterized coiled-coil protein SlyX
MIGWVKGIAALAIVTAIGTTIFLGYKVFTDLQSENTRLEADNATLIGSVAALEQGIAEQQATIAQQQRDIELQSEIFRETDNNFSRARDQIDALRDRLGRHEIGALAVGRPGLVENVINNATDAVGRCIEIATGSPLTTQEKNATLRSEINTECPDLANPNYEGPE